MCGVPVNVGTREAGHGTKAPPAWTRNKSEAVPESGRGTWYPQEGSARTEGARRATGVRADGAAAGAGALAAGAAVERPAGSGDVVLRCVANRWRRCPVRRAWRSTGSKRGGSEPWRLELGLKDRSRRPVAAGARRGEASHRGTSMEIGSGPGPAAPPFGDAEVATMSETTAAATGRCLSRSCVGHGSARARRSTRVRARAHHHRLGAGPGGGGRRRGNRTRSYWRRFGPISLGPRSTAKAIARSTHGFGSWTGSESPARGCCASCGRTDCSPRTAGVRAPLRPTAGGSSPRRPT